MEAESRIEELFFYLSLLFALQFYEDTDIFRPFNKYFLVLGNQVTFGFKMRSNMSTAVFLNRSATFFDQNIPIFLRQSRVSISSKFLTKKLQNLKKFNCVSFHRTFYFTRMSTFFFNIFFIAICKIFSFVNVYFF